MQVIGAELMRDADGLWADGDVVPDPDGVAIISLHELPEAIYVLRSVHGVFEPRLFVRWRGRDDWGRIWLN